MTQAHANRNLLLVAFMWGTSYTFIKMAIAGNMPPSVINGLRGLISAILVYIFFHKVVNDMTLEELELGSIAGLLNFVVVQLQSTGLQFTTSSNSSFITATYVIFLPFFTWIFFGKTPPKKIYVSIVICMIGMLFLTKIITNGLEIHIGDTLTILTAIVFAGQLAYYSFTMQKVRPQNIAFLLGAVQAVLALIYSTTIDLQRLPQINWQQSIIPVIILGVVATFAAQVLQVSSQKYIDTVTAGLILMTESLFASIISVIFGFEPMTKQLIIGGTLIIISTLIAEFDIRGLITRYIVTKKRVHFRK
ncbi:DMT family transporter [Companilactobacillus mishanensis]|uniref:DMT family transporter n=1 Tax=Companilactobacillus mishanensis TaxID=2486008 RepID=A0ABW9P8B8_9LACO|nr:DMT family transporter [Companilactobacillus mishanensis]MQS45398.1 DMT family transporter [Companilactobacillus mishanensis]